MNIETRFTSALQVATDLLVVFTVDQSTPESTAGSSVFPVTVAQAIHNAGGEFLTSGEFKSAANETLLLHSPAGFAAKRLLLVGLGRAAVGEAGKGPGLTVLRRAAGTAARYAKTRGLKSIAITIPETLVEATDAQAARAVVEGVIVGDFDSDTYATDRKDKSLTALTIVAAEHLDQPGITAGVAEGTILAEAQNFSRFLVNEPGNSITPTKLGEHAKAMSEKYGLHCDVFGADTLHELKMGAFWAVTKGSYEPPALIVMTYTPADLREEAPVLGLVGKGITFDTGGISLKPGENMEKMKYDMAGGASMIGAMQAIAQLKPPVKVIGIVCAAENMPSGRAYKPGDIVTAMSGKTIEVINTDAEGRLVLADGLAYAKQLGATHLIDAATLTGAVAVALGLINAGVFANDDATYEKFAAAAKTVGERFWRLPLEDEYRESIKSQIADIRNTGGRYAGAVTAAMFLKEFVGDTPWLHLDIAGTTWLDDAKSWIASGPSGVGVQTIIEWVRSYPA